MSQMKEKYQSEIAPALLKKLNLTNVSQVPKLEKVVLNVCISEAVKNPKVLNTAVDELTAITGQKAVFGGFCNIATRQYVVVYGAFYPFWNSAC